MSIKYFFSDTNDGNLAYHVLDFKENVDKNRENGKPDNFCGEQKQRIMKFW